MWDFGKALQDNPKYANQINWVLTCRYAVRGVLARIVTVDRDYRDPYLRQGCNLVPDIDKPREFKVVNLDGTRPDAAMSHEEALKYADEAMKAFGIGKDREERFDASLAEKAGEAKPEKVKGEVVSVDAASKKFKLKAGRGKEVEIAATDATAITKGKDATTFEAVVTVGATLNVEVLNGVAATITGKK